MESQPQNCEFRINPENFHPCEHGYDVIQVFIPYKRLLSKVLSPFQSSNFLRIILTSNCLSDLHLKNKQNGAQSFDSL